MHGMAAVLASGWAVLGGDLKTLVAAFIVGIAVGITGMGGGALMTPALILLGVANPSTVVTADLTAAAVYKSGGAAVHWRHGAPNLALAGWLVLGSVPMALLGPQLLARLTPAGVDPARALTLSIGFALLLAASTYVLRLALQLSRSRSGAVQPAEPRIRPVPTVLVGALGGLLVGITSVGSGSVIMIALLMLYPGLPALRLVGTDLVQAVPLVMAAAVSNILAHGLDLGVTLPLIAGSVPGALLGARLAPRVPTSLIRRGIVIVLTMSGLALLDKAGWAPLGSGSDQTHPILIGIVGLALAAAMPLAWGLVRRRMGLPAHSRPWYGRRQAARSG
ncbi:MAG TPA: sulfite exporter TauE/SafE family protein [Nocardioidaceae bacterium]|nr:sulfite exporter TauE/SafE family protein [Nocardioidaceae bacterium]